MGHTDSDAIRDYARRQYVEPARRRGEDVVRIQAGEVHRALGLTNRVPVVCRALGSQTFLNESELELERREGPPSGISTTVVFTYRFRNKGAEGRFAARGSQFHALRGIAESVFASPGGGEAFLRGERAQFLTKSDLRV